MLNNKRIVLLRIFLIYLIIKMCCSLPILGDQADFEDNSKIQGKRKPIFKFCDEIGNHLNCMLYCKSMGHASGNCGGDFICSCF